MVVGARHQEPLKRLYRGPSLFLTRFGPCGGLVDIFGVYP